MGLLDEAIREHLELKRLRGADPVDVARMEREALGPARRPEPAADLDSDGPLSEQAVLEREPLAGTEAPFEAPAPGDFEHDLEPEFPAEEPLAGELDPGRGAAFDHLDQPPGVGPADDRSIAPASYGQETAEFDVESAALDDPLDAFDDPGDALDEAAGPAAAVPAPHAPDLTGAGPIADPIAAPPASPYESGPYVDADVEGPADLLEEVAGEAPPPAGLEPPPADLEEERTQVHPAAEPHVRPSEEAAVAGEAAADGVEEEAEDVLEETPDFLQETPEHERLWFEQRPPRDFDFDK